eukprot:CAMPEP_0176498110 /NCGR_PEP_ID=MMETSP0200_2-20121128/12124_1 /TAXON_ID=947934 /ORGANISM="Chaetoceros sp., Strain GSL56" /LENGTH=581 /DNA_ID=CAMNT_0017896251 /DNA_START=47 /DNA_END=1792 /DNA_ORIENTATION=-
MTNPKNQSSSNPSNESSSNNARAFADLEKYLSGYHLNSNVNVKKQSDDIRVDKTQRRGQYHIIVGGGNNNHNNNNHNRIDDTETSEELESPSRLKQSELMIIRQEEQVNHRSNESKTHHKKVEHCNSMDNSVKETSPPLERRLKSKEIGRPGDSSYWRKPWGAVDVRTRDISPLSTTKARLPVSRINQENRGSKRSLHHEKSSLKYVDKNDVSRFARNNSVDRHTLSQTQRLAAATKTSSILLYKQKKKQKTTTATVTMAAVGESSLIRDDEERSFFGPMLLSNNKMTTRNLGMGRQNPSCFRHPPGNDDGILHHTNCDDLHTLAEMNKCNTDKGLDNDNQNDDESNNYSHHFPLWKKGCRLQQPSVASQKPKSRRRRTKGPLTKLLNMTRVSLEADCARLRSGSYPYRPFEMRKHDANDPRNRADTIMDVTIIGHPSPFTSLDYAMVVVLGLVHEYKENTLKIRTIRTPGRSRRICHSSSPKVGVIEEGDSMDVPRNFENNLTNDKESLSQTPSNAWLCFRCDTCADLGIAKGTQLRMYNPQFISLQESFSVVVCTRLCEIYPSDLPPLVVPSHIRTFGT